MIFPIFRLSKNYKYLFLSYFSLLFQPLQSDAYHIESMLLGNFKRFSKKILCSYPTVVYKASDLIFINNYIYISKYNLYHYTLVV